MSKITVLTLTYKDSYIERNPDSPRRRIKLVRTSKAEEALQSRQDAKRIFGRRYRRILQSGDDAPCFFELHHQAYRHILSRIQDAEASGGRLAFDDPGGHQVYIIELSHAVRDFKTMVKANEDELIETADTFCYVGQTSCAADDRYKQHRNPEDEKNSDWGLEYFKAPFEAAYRADLLDAFTAATGQATQDLKKSQAHIVEADVAFWLRERVIAAYFR